MVMISKNARLKYYLNNAPAHAPEDIESTEIIADFSDENVQANITASAWTFYNSDAVTIRDWKTAGKIYEGLPFKIEAYNNQNNLIAFDGLLDLTDNYKDDFADSLRVTVNMKQAEGLNIFFDQLSALSYGFLESEGVFTQNDYQKCKYVVEKKINLFEELTAGIILYLMVQELISQIKLISDTIAEGVAHGSGGVTGAVAAAIYFAAKIAIQIVYAASILIVIIDLAKKLFDTLLPPVRTHKTLKLKTAMSKVCQHLGYGFNSTITELDELYYLPSNPQLEAPKLTDFLNQNVGTQTGIPFASDSHYKCSVFFELMKKLFNGKFAIVGGVVQFHPKGSAYWVINSTYVLPKVKPKTTTTNAGELVADRVLSFAYDLTDEYTVDNYTGTTYEIQTRATGLSNQKANLIKGFDGVDFDLCLGTAKTELSELEKQLATIGGVIDGVVNTFGGSQNFAGQVNNNKTNILKQTANWHALPKILKLNGDKLATDNRASFSAKQLYNKYYAYDSFVLSNFGGQKEVFTDVKIPFGMNDFIELINNSYFKDSQNRTGKIISIKWNVLSDTATADYWVKVPFTTQLQETYIEP